MSVTWDELSSWWLDEIADDPVFATDVLPLVLATMPPDPGSGLWLDAGCGDGRVMRELPVRSVGCDVSTALLDVAVTRHPVVRSILPSLSWIADGSLDGVVIVLTLEHLADAPTFFREVGRVVRPGGSLVLVANHPAFTAEGSGPVIDMTDGEVLWRWGPYFESAEVPTEIGADQSVLFHHRPLGHLLTLAADAGLALASCDERPLSAAAIRTEPGYQGQETTPRLVGIRWEQP